MDWQWEFHREELGDLCRSPSVLRIVKSRRVLESIRNFCGEVSWEMVTWTEGLGWEIT